MNKVAQMAHDGIARTVRPSHPMFDGDTLFALATGERKADVNLVGAHGAEAMSAPSSLLCARRKGLRGFQPGGICNPALAEASVVMSG